MTAQLTAWRDSRLQCREGTQAECGGLPELRRRSWQATAVTVGREDESAAQRV